VCTALFQLRRVLMAGLVVSGSFLSHLTSDDLQELGQPPVFFPLLHLTSLLKNGDRWCVAEFRRELHRDPEMRRWNHAMIVQLLGCLLLVICGGLLKDDIMLPTLYMVLDDRVNQVKHADLHNHFLRPVGSIMAAVGATLMMQRLLVPLVECALWVTGAGLPCRSLCADYSTAGINAVWLVIYAGFEVSSEYRSQRIVGLLLLMLSIVRCALLLTGGYMLRTQTREPVPPEMPGPRMPVLATPGGAVQRQNSGGSQYLSHQGSGASLNSGRSSGSGSKAPRAPSPVQIGSSSQADGSSAAPTASFFQAPEMVALAAKLPLIAQLGFVEASGPPDGTSNRTWQVSPLGRLWLAGNVVACVVFFFVCSLLQKLWQPLREEGLKGIDSRVIVAGISAAVMILSFVNVVPCSLHMLIWWRDINS